MKMALVCLLSICCTAQVPEKAKFNVRVLSVKRVGDGCTARVDSTKVRYIVTSDVSGSCAMLRAGEDYHAFVANIRPEGTGDDSSDRAVLIIENNVNNPERRNAGFDIESQEVIAAK